MPVRRAAVLGTGQGGKAEWEMVLEVLCWVRFVKIEYHSWNQYDKKFCVLNTCVAPVITMLDQASF